MLIKSLIFQVSKKKQIFTAWLLNFWKKSYLNDYSNLQIYQYPKKGSTYTVIKATQLLEILEYKNQVFSN